MTHTIHADKRAFTVAGPAFPETSSLSVSLANRRIWTFRPTDGTRSGDRLTIPWPAALVPRLTGSADLLLLQDRIPVCGPTTVHFDDSGNEFTLTEPGTGIPQVINKWGRVGRSFEGRDPALIQRFLDLGFISGVVPIGPALMRMDAFRDRLLQAFTPGERPAA